MTKPIAHVMLDIETLGIRPGFVVLSAALVRFEDLAITSVNLDIAEQQAIGLQVDPSTAEWWSQQPPETWAAAASNALPLAVGLGHLHAWLEWAAGGRDAMIWCHGAAFDAPLLAEVYRLAGAPCPWSYRGVRDTRTLYDLAGVDLRLFSYGREHVAADDAMGQTLAAIEAMRILAERRGMAT